MFPTIFSPVYVFFVNWFGLDHKRLTFYPQSHVFPRSHVSKEKWETACCLDLVLYWDSKAFDSHGFNSQCVFNSVTWQSLFFFRFNPCQCSTSLSLEKNFFSLTWIRIIVAQLIINFISEPFCKMSSNLLHVEQERYLHCLFCLYMSAIRLQWTCLVL